MYHTKGIAYRYQPLFNGNKFYTYQEAEERTDFAKDKQVDKSAKQLAFAYYIVNVNAGNEKYLRQRTPEYPVC